jgi:hypothetical protein
MQTRQLRFFADGRVLQGTGTLSGVWKSGRTATSVTKRPRHRGGGEIGAANTLLGRQLHCRTLVVANTGVAVQLPPQRRFLQGVLHSLELLV